MIVTIQDLVPFQRTVDNACLAQTVVRHIWLRTVIAACLVTKLNACDTYCKLNISIKGHMHATGLSR